MSNVKIPSADDEKYDLMVALDSIIDALPAYRRAERMADGKFDEYSPTPEIDDLLKEYSRYYMFELAAIVIRTLNNRIKLASISVGDSLQEAFDTVWKVNLFQSWYRQLQYETLKYGDYYVEVWPVAGDLTPDGEAVTVDTVTLTLKNPKSTRMIYDPIDQRTALYVVSRWKEGKRWYADLTYPERVEHWRTLADNTEGNDPKDWQRYEPEIRVATTDGYALESVPDVETHDLGIPVIHFRTELPYGVPVHKSAYGPQNAIAKMLVTLVATLDQQGWPTRVALVDPVAVLDQNSDSPDWPDDTNSTNEQIKATPSSSLRSGPGMLQVLTGIKNVLSLDAADPTIFTGPAESMMDMLSVISGTPLYALKPGGEQPSGRARELADAPLKAKEEATKELLEVSLESLAKQILAMLNKESSEIEIQWAPSVMASGVDDWTEVDAKVKSGVPISVALEEAGYDSDTVTGWLEERQEYSLTESIDLLQKVGDAIAKMGTAVGFNVLTEEQAHTVLTALLSQLGINIGAFVEPDPQPVALQQNPPPPPGQPVDQSQQEGPIANVD